MIRRGIGVQSFVSAGGAGTDADAQAFIDAAGITDATQQSAINALVTDLKGYGIWTKMKAVYPFVGGTSSSHKWNLKDPRDLDAAFRLVFSGGWTHSSNGALPNGTNGYADTKLNENSVLSNNSEHISIYSRSNTLGVAPDLSAYDGTYESNIYSRLNNLIYARIQGTSPSATSNTDSRGFFIANRTNNTQVFAYKNNTKYTVSSNFQSKVNNTFVFSRVSQSLGSYGDREYAFASIGDGLTDTEAANLYTAVQAYQTSLSRNV